MVYSGLTRRLLKEEHGAMHTHLLQDPNQDIQQLRLLNAVETCLHVDLDEVQLRTTAMSDFMTILTVINQMLLQFSIGLPSG